jgi:putative tRNA adenosine deaminase-associated protein
VPYFAAALARTGAGWTAHEVDLDDVETIDDVVDLLRDLEEDADTTLLFVEEDDEYVAIVRVDGEDEEPRVFVSDGRAADNFPIAGILADGAEPVSLDEEDEDTAPAGHDSEPFGDAALLSDLGISQGELLELCSHEGLLPSDVVSAVCEKAGCLDELEALREGL